MNREKQIDTPTNTPTQNQFTNYELEQIEGIAKVIHDSDMNYNTYFPISMSECLHRHGAVRTNAAIALHNEGYRKQSENTVEWPYKVGQMVYVLRSQTSNGKNLYLREERIDHYRIFGERSFMCFESGRLSVPDYLWETTVFLSKEEADAKMKGESK